MAKNSKLSKFGMRTSGKHSFSASTLKKRAAKQKTDGIFVDISENAPKYPGFPAIPLMDMAARKAIKEVNKAETELKKYIRDIASFSHKSRSELKGKGSQVSREGQPFKRSKYTSGTSFVKASKQEMSINQKQSKKDTLGFSMFFDSKSFDAITKQISGLIYDQANIVLQNAVIKTVKETREKIKHGKSSDGVEVGKLTTNKFRPHDRIYSTLANSLFYFEKGKGVLQFNRPINPLMSFGIGSFNYTSLMTIKASNNKKPTGIFGSRMSGGKFGGVSKKSLTELYAAKVMPFKRKSSPLGGYKSLKQ